MSVEATLAGAGFAYEQTDKPKAILIMHLAMKRIGIANTTFARVDIGKIQKVYTVMERTI